MEEDVQQAAQLELGGECVTEPPDGRLQPSTFALDKLEPLLGLIDAPAALTCQPREEEHDRQYEQNRERATTHGDCREEAERRQGRVSHPDDRNDLHLDAELEHNTGEPRPKDRAREVDDAAGCESGNHQRQFAEADRRRSGREQHERGTYRVPCVRQRRKDPPGRYVTARAVECIPDHQPETNGDRHRRGREHHKHRDENQLGRHNVTSAHCELDAPDHGVDRDEQSCELRT